MLLRDERGFTLAEVLVVMSIFVIVIMITSNGFKTALTQVGQQSKSMETEIGSIVGLEMLRSDLQNTGYGLPWSFQNTPDPSKYTEVTNLDSGSPIGGTFWPTGKSPLSFNDAISNAPRAVQNGNTTFNLDTNGVGSQYLVLKSLSLVPGATPKKTVTITYNTLGVRSQLQPVGLADRDLSASEWVFVIRNTFSDSGPSRQLQVSSGGTFSTTFSNFTTLTQPHSSGDVFQVYGVNAADASMSSLRMPFNRADYYVRTPATVPPTCAPHTGTLYKAYVSQKSGGGFTELPLLDCVADMQVAYGLGAADGSINYYASGSTNPAPLAAYDATAIRNQIKEIRLYILSHEGKKDPSFTYPSSTITVGESLLGVPVGRTFNLSSLIGTGWQNYRWKLYTIVVRPKNLIQ